ncbi:MAG: hypothetical protein V4576_02640 [Patescibacteria group bacterium]
MPNTWKALIVSLPQLLVSTIINQAEKYPEHWDKIEYLDPTRKNDIKPNLHEKFYPGVKWVRDTLLTLTTRRRLIGMEAGATPEEAFAQILEHEHGKIKEKFRILRCDYPGHCFLVLTNEDGSLKKVPLEVGMEHIAYPGDVHGIICEKGILVFEIIVENFDTNDIKGYTPPMARAA